MHARILRTRVLPGTMDKAVGVFRASINPHLENKRGCLGIFLLTNRELNEITTLSFWESAETMRLAFDNDFLDQQAAKIKMTVAAEPIVGTTYEVADSVGGYLYSLDLRKEP